MAANGVRLLTGNAHPELAERVAARLGTTVTPCVLKRFADQSIDVRLGASVRDEDVFVLQTSSGPTTDTNDALMELLVLISTCKGASARRITAVIPSFPYSRHDKKDKSRQPITGKLVANMITTAGADHVIAMDLHSAQVQGFFDIPVDNLVAEPSVARWIRASIRGWQEAIIVSPDAGGAKRASAVAEALGLDFALINRHKRREGDRMRASASLGDGEVTPLSGSLILDHKPSPTGAALNAILDDSDDDGEEDILVGQVTGRTAILVDDMIITGRTLAMAVRTLKDAGAASVYSINIHGLLSAKAIELINTLPLEKVVVTNTVSQALTQTQMSKLEVMDVSGLLAESVRRTHNGESISALFQEDAAMF